MIIVVLNDGETYTNANGCRIMEVPEGMDQDELEYIVKNHTNRPDKGVRTLIEFRADT